MPSEEHSGSSVFFTHALNMKSYGKSQLSLSPRSIQLRTGNKTHKSQHVQVALDAKSTGCATSGVTVASGRSVLWSLMRRWFCHLGDTWPCLETRLCYNLWVGGCSGRWRPGVLLNTPVLKMAPTLHQEWPNPKELSTALRKSSALVWHFPIQLSN